MAGAPELPPVDPKPSTEIFGRERVHRARNPSHSRNGRGMRFALDRARVHGLRAFELGDAHGSLQGEVLRPRSAEIGSLRLAPAARAATDPTAGRGDRSQPP